MRFLFTNRSPTQHASTIEYDQLRITQEASGGIRHATLRLFFLLRRSGISSNMDSSPRRSRIPRPISPPAPCMPWSPEDISRRVQATARGKSQIPARRREGARPRRPRSVRLRLQSLGMSASWFRPSPATASCLSRVNTNAGSPF